MIKKINYGVDAPIIVRNLFLIGIILIGLAIIFPVVKIGSANISSFSSSVISGIICFVTGLLMLLYARIGKFRHRNRMLKLIKWTGNEMVLDVGTGLGLLMIGAAKFLTNGKAIGIDIWNKDDLSKNSSGRTMSNAQLEGVMDKIEIKDENILHTNFRDNYFEVVLSNLCLHNIYDKEGRQTACREIHRVLKQYGTAIISDYKHCKEYKEEFRKLGMFTEKIGTYYFDTFPPLTIIRAVKK